MMEFSSLNRLLYNVVTSSKLLNKFLFEFEKLLFLKKIEDYKNNKHIYVCGLPRSGTTIITNYIYNTKLFGSLIYKDMPFVICPNFFSRFTKSNKQIISYERMHEDGIKININSPEALDHFFFLIFEENYKENIIDYVNLILHKTSKKRYLSKNNNAYKKTNRFIKIISKHDFFNTF